MSQSFLGRYYDAAMEIPKDESEAKIAAGEIERISRALAIVVHASAVPRRLGSEATDEELAADKRRCRRVGHALKQALLGWNRNKKIVLPNDEELKREGAQLDWEKWKHRHQTKVREQLRYTVTWAMREDPPKERWAKSAVVNLENELNWVEYALR